MKIEIRAESSNFSGFPSGNLQRQKRAMSSLGLDYQKAEKRNDCEVLSIIRRAEKDRKPQPTDKSPTK